jgi:hypothetical protein
MVALEQANDTKDLTQVQRPLVVHRKLVNNLVIDRGVSRYVRLQRGTVSPVVVVGPVSLHSSSTADQQVLADGMLIEEGILVRLIMPVCRTVSSRSAILSSHPTRTTLA